jgi:hypothetical protein
MKFIDITITCGAKATWNNDLTNLKFSLLHIKEWIESISCETCRPIFLDFRRGEKVVAKAAGLVLLEKKKTLGKQLFFYAPPSTIDGLPQTMSDCLEALAAYSRKNHFSRIKQFPFDLKTHQPFDAHKYKVTAYKEYIFNLDAEYLTFKPGPGLRKKLQLAENAATEFHVSNDIEHLDLLIDLMQKTQDMRVERHCEKYNLFSFKYVNRESLKYLIEQKKAIIYYSLNHGEIHYLTLSLEFDNKAYGLYNGTDAFGYENGLPAFMATKLAHYYQLKGFGYFNLGANPPNKIEDFNLSNFKKQLGCTPVDVYCAHSEFLTFPQTIITLAMKAGKKLPHNGITKTVMKAIN